MPLCAVSVTGVLGAAGVVIGGGEIDGFAVAAGGGKEAELVVRMEAVDADFATLADSERVGIKPKATTNARHGRRGD